MPLYLGGTPIGGANVSVTTPKLQNKIVTPTTSEQIITPDSNYDGLSKVNVGAIPSSYIQPSGTKSITENGTHDVTDFASVNVNVAGSGGGGAVETCSFTFNKAQYVKPYGVHFLTYDGSAVTRGSITMFPLSMETTNAFDTAVKNSMILLESNSSMTVTLEGDISAIAEYTGQTSGLWYSAYFIYGDATINV